MASLFHKLLDGAKKEPEKAQKQELSKDRAGSSQSRSVDSQSVDEEQDMNFQNQQMEEYKTNLVSKCKKQQASYHHGDFKTKLMAMDALQKDTFTINTKRNRLVASIEHSFKDSLVLFSVQLVQVDFSKMMLKSQIMSMPKISRLLEVNVNHKTKQEAISTFCQQELINLTDEISLTNYVFSITEAQRIALESKKLILQIQNFKTDEVLQECHMQNKFLIADMKQTTKKPDYTSLRDHNQKSFENYVKDRKKQIQKQIFKNLKYKGLPYRLYFDREYIYREIREKLIANLYMASNLVLKEGTKIIQRYNRLEFYIEELAFGKKKQFQKKSQKRNLTVDILLKKQKQVKPTIDYATNNRPSSLTPYGGANSKIRNTDLGKYRFTNMKLEISPDRSGKELNPFELKRGISKQGYSQYDNSSATYGAYQTERNKGPAMSKFISTKECHDTNMSRMHQSQMPDTNEDQNLFIQSKNAKHLDQLIKNYCGSVN